MVVDRGQPILIVLVGARNEGLAHGDSASTIKTTRSLVPVLPRTRRARWLVPRAYLRRGLSHGCAAGGGERDDVSRAAPDNLFYRHRASGAAGVSAPRI
jgi:hypothetical protein